MTSAPPLSAGLMTISVRFFKLFNASRSLLVSKIVSCQLFLRPIFSSCLTASMYSFIAGSLELLGILGAALLSFCSGVIVYGCSSSSE